MQIARALEGQSADVAVFHQPGVKAAPAQAAANMFQQHQQHLKKKGRLALTLQDQSWAVQPVGSCWLQSHTQQTF